MEALKSKVHDETSLLAEQRSLFAREREAHAKAKQEAKANEAKASQLSAANTSAWKRFDLNSLPWKQPPAVTEPESKPVEPSELTSPIQAQFVDFVHVARDAAQKPTAPPLQLESVAETRQPSPPHASSEPYDPKDPNDRFVEPGADSDWRPPEPISVSASQAARAAQFEMERWAAQTPAAPNGATQTMIVGKISVTEEKVAVLEAKLQAECVTRRVIEERLAVAEARRLQPYDAAVAVLPNPAAVAAAAVNDSAHDAEIAAFKSKLELAYARARI